MTDQLARKKVGIRLARHATPLSADQRWAHELEALAPVADIVDILADTPAEFAAAAGDLDAVITSWGIRIDREVIGALKRCVVIGVGGVGVDMVDVEAATAAGIVVTNVPDVFIEEVADQAMMLLLNIARMTPLMTKMAREGQWYEARPILSRQDRLLGSTLGLFGFGNVAKATASRARAFGLRIIAHDPYVSELEISAAGVEPVSFGELLERSDYLSVHAPHNAETEHAIDAAALRRMKPTAGLINTARGPLVDGEALIEALREGVIAGAGLDVTEPEPLPPDSPLLSMDNVIVTPHIASASTRMRPATRRRVGREVALVLRGRWPMSCVNPTVLPRAELERWQPYPMNRGPNR
jgi:D-3-phosphoglycerate dehydrogenase